jgi:hypothetical protein
MTYTFKLARRLAVSRDSAVLASLLFLAACAAETPMAPDSADESRLVSTGSLIIWPRTVTAEINQVIKLRGMLRNSRGDTPETHVSWSSNGGRITTDGRFSSTTPGTFKVLGRGRGWKQDTSVVVVVPPQPTLVALAVSPDSASVLTGAQKIFSAIGHLSDGTTAPLGVTWTATGGTIDAGGAYTAGPTDGTYQVVATNTAGTVADTASVTVNPPPAPPPPPVVPVRLIVGPSTASVAAGATKQFSASAKMSDSSVTAPAVTWTATGGTITSAGLYKAGSTAGTYSVKAVSGSLSASASVTVPAAAPMPPASGSGVSFGSYECTGSTLGPFNLCIRAAGYWSAKDMAALQATGSKLMLNQGGYGKFQTAAGTYDPVKYYNWVQTLKPYVASWQPYLADGTLVGVQVIDDIGTMNWGGVAITKAQIEEMAKWWKQLAPGITTFVREKATGLTGFTWVYLDASITQYNARYMGDVTKWRDSNVVAARNARVGLMLSMNTLNGGKVVAGCYHGGSPTYCSMSPTELRTYGAVQAAAPEGCGLMSWKSDPEYHLQPGVAEALTYLAGLAKTRPAVSCKVR